jgi:hypothetical protein
MKYQKILMVVFSFGCLTPLFGQTSQDELSQQVIILEEQLHRKTRNDSLLSMFRKTMVSYLKSPISLSDDRLENVVEIDIDDHDKIKLYRYDYDPSNSGCYSYYFIQWKNNKGKLFAYDLTNKFSKREFGTMYHLGSSGSSDLYLIYTWWHEQFADFCVAYPDSQGFCVFQIKGDYLVLDYPAFNGGSCVESLDYDYKYFLETKTIKGSLGGPNEYDKFAENDRTIRHAYVIYEEFKFNDSSFIKQ